MGQACLPSQAHAHCVQPPERDPDCTTCCREERRQEEREKTGRRGERKKKKKCDEVEGCRWIAGVGKKDGHMCWLWSERVGSRKNICSRLSLMVSSHADGWRFICWDFKEADLQRLGHRAETVCSTTVSLSQRKIATLRRNRRHSKSTAASLFSITLWHHLADSLPVRYPMVSLQWQAYRCRITEAWDFKSNHI